MALEAQDVMQNFRSVIHSRLSYFLFFSILLHISLISIFIHKNKNISLVTEKKIFVHLIGGGKEKTKEERRVRNLKKLSEQKTLQKNSAFHKGQELPPNHFTNTQNTSSNSTSIASTASFETNYPRLSRILKEQGEVVFKIKKSDQKEVLNFEMIKSSRHRRLDLAAEEALVTNKEQILHLIQDENIEHIRFEFKLARKEP